MLAGWLARSAWLVGLRYMAFGICKTKPTTNNYANAASYLTQENRLDRISERDHWLQAYTTR